MEFLIVSSPILESLQQPLEQFLSDAPQLRRRDRPLQYFNFGSLFLAANNLISNDVCAIGFDGHATINGKSYLSADNQSPSVEEAIKYLDGCMDPVNTSDMQGIFSLVRVNPHTKAFSVSVDPFSSYPVFVCGFGETLIVSNNSFLIAAAVKSFGLSLTRSSKALAYQASLGSGSGDRSGYREVSLLPVGKTVTGIGPNWRLLDMAKPALGKPASYNEWLENCAHRLTGHIKTWAASVSSRQPLTMSIGTGIRSNIILSATARAGVSFDQLAFRTEDDPSASLLERSVSVLFEDAKHTKIRTYCAGPQTHQGFLQAVQLSQGLASYNHLWCETQDSEENRLLTDAADEALFYPYTAPKWGSLFWRSPFSRMIRLSNGDPVFTACAARFLVGLGNANKRSAARWTYSFSRQNRAFADLFHKDFLRQVVKTQLDELEAHLSTPRVLRPEYYQRNSMRRHAGTFYLASENTPASSPLLDPLLSARALHEFGPGVPRSGFFKDLLDVLAGKQVSRRLRRLSGTRPRSPAGERSPNQHYQDLLKSIKPQIVDLANVLPAHAEPWTYLHRKKLTAILGSPIKLNPADVLSLYQMLLWGTGAPSDSDQP